MVPIYLKALVYHYSNRQITVKSFLFMEHYFSWILYVTKLNSPNTISKVQVTLIFGTPKITKIQESMKVYAHEYIQEFLGAHRHYLELLVAWLPLDVDVSWIDSISSFILVGRLPTRRRPPLERDVRPELLLEVRLSFLVSVSITLSSLSATWHTLML